MSFCLFIIIINSPQDVGPTEHTLGNANLSYNIEIKVLEGTEVYLEKTELPQCLRHKVIKTTTYYDCAQNRH